jgi:hypothetical protein
MPGPRKRKTFSFYCLNIRLLSSDRKASEAIPGIMENLRRKKIWKKTKGETRIMIRSIWPVEYEEENFFGGYFSKFTHLSGDWLNFDNMEPEKIQVPKNRFPNLRDSDFYFIPSIHRIFIEKSSHTSLFSIMSFLEQSLNEFAKPGEQVKVVMENSEALLEKIYTAKAVRKLNISVTYSNDDDYDESVAAMDRFLRKGHVGTAKMNFSPDASDDLAVRESPLLYGLVGLAKNNGDIDSTIINTEGKREKVMSSRYPKIFRVISDGIALLPYNLYRTAKGIFRRVK